MRNKIAKIKEWFSIIFIFLIVYGVLLGVCFWIQQGNEFIPNKVPISKCRFFETTKENEVPYVEIGVNKKGEWKFDYKFYISKGAISRSYNLD